MIIETENLVKISTYAKEINKTVAWVYRLIETNRVKMIKIDGVNFIKKE